jgi:deoxyxylulose-5-phosphate synthase
MAKSKTAKSKKSTVKRKAAPKKKAVKKTSSKKKTSKPFAKVSKTVYFIRVDGQPITSLVDLAKQVDNMADDVFYHHVTEDRNDFATWVDDIINDKTLAKSIGKMKDRERMCYTIMHNILHKL